MDRLIKLILAGKQPGFEEFLESWGAIFPLLHELEGTPQDPIWHQEGNVRVHTAMVLEEIYRQIDGCGETLAAEQRLVLVLGALLHDVAKPLVTRETEREGRRRIISPGHAERGRAYLALKLGVLGIGFTLQQQVLRLVGHHHDPKFLVIRNRPERDYYRLARQCDLALLYHLELADMRGRICRDREQQIEYIEWFRAFAEEYRLWTTFDPYRHWRDTINTALGAMDQDTRDLVLGEAIRDFEAGRISMPEAALARSYGYRDAFPRLVITCGPSGAGKSSWIANNLPGYEVISLDDLRTGIAGRRSDQSHNSQVLQAAKEMLKAALRAQRPVVWDATNLRIDFRKRLAQLGFDYHALVTLVLFHTPETSLFARNRLRAHPIPEAALARHLEILEWPTPDEAHRIWHIGEDGEMLGIESGGRQ